MDTASPVVQPEWFLFARLMVACLGFNGKLYALMKGSEREVFTTRSEDMRRAAEIRVKLASKRGV